MDHPNGWIEKDGSRSLQDKTIIERIMLRFRPIAPKPDAGSLGSCSVADGKGSELVSKARKKRKYVRVKNTRKCKIEDKKVQGCSINLDFKVDETSTGWLKLDNRFGMDNGFFGGGGVDRINDKVVESWMMVEGVSVTSDMWLGSTDMEKMKNLEMDECPGFISDGFDRVQWVNVAYRKLVVPMKDDGKELGEVVASLVVNEKLPEVCQAFACTVRVVYSWRSDNNRENDNNNGNSNKKKYVSQTMPCDVWRMDFGGFAWRLDAKAALSLGR